MTDANQHKPPARGVSRRRLLQGSLAGSAAAVLFRGAAAPAFAAAGPVALSPVYYPKDPTAFTQGVDIAGTLAIVTGAPRGNGRAIAEALAAANVV